MNYWLTVHWPLPKHEKIPKIRNVNLPDGYRYIGEEMKIGDLIFIYEYKTGRKFKDRPCERVVGRQGIIALFKVISKIEPRKPKPTEYEDGSKIWWRWRIRAEFVKECSIFKKDVCKVLGYSPNYNFRGFGYLKKITKSQFQALKSMCK